MRGVIFYLACLVLVVTSPLSADSPPQGVFGGLQPALLTADGESIGIFTGPSITFNQHGVKVKAFGFLTPKGYLAALLPSGELGKAKSLYFETNDCKGKPYVLSENESDVSNSYLPGYVFSFDDPRKAYSIPKASRALQRTFNSKRVITARQTECVVSTVSVSAYSVVTNEINKTGIPSNAFSGLLIDVQSIQQETHDLGKQPPFSIWSETRALDSIDLNQPLEVCSPGCDNDMISNGYCEPECNNRACGYDSNDCTALEIDNAMKKEEAQCAPLCEVEDLGDGYCDRYCNNSACDFDQGDCPIK